MSGSAAGPIRDWPTTGSMPVCATVHGHISVAGEKAELLRTLLVSDAVVLRAKSPSAVTIKDSMPASSWVAAKHWTIPQLTIWWLCQCRCHKGYLLAKTMMATGSRRASWCRAFCRLSRLGQTRKHQSIPIIGDTKTATASRACSRHATTRPSSPSSASSTSPPQDYERSLS